MKCLRQPNSLFNVLNKSYNFSVEPCNLKRCKCCKSIIPKKDYLDVNGQYIYFNNHMNCTTDNVIYILFCNKCNHFYIGETSLALNLRINLHRQHINNPIYSILHVSNHLRHCSLGFSVIPIYKVPYNSNYLRKHLENYFISYLKPQLNC